MNTTLLILAISLALGILTLGFLRRREDVQAASFLNVVGLLAFGGFLIVFETTALHYAAPSPVGELVESFRYGLSEGGAHAIIGGAVLLAAFLLIMSALVLASTDLGNAIDSYLWERAWRRREERAFARKRWAVRI